MNPRVAIRASIYRDRAGFLVYGWDTRGRRVRIFTPNRADAERIKANVKAGDPDPTAHWEI